MEKSISPSELKEMIDENQLVTLLDVREEHEVAVANMGGTHIPLSELEGRTAELNVETPIVTICHHGARSARAQELLLNQGFTSVANLEGGIDRWSLEIDSSIPRY